MYYDWKTLQFTVELFLLCILAFLCISYNSTINTYKFKSSVEVYPIDVNPIEVYPIEAYLIGKGVVEVSGCHQTAQISVHNFILQGIVQRILRRVETGLIRSMPANWRPASFLFEF